MYFTANSLYCYIVANCVSINYYLISEKGYEKIQRKLRGYEWVERLRTTALVEAGRTDVQIAWPLLVRRSRL